MEDESMKFRELINTNANVLDNIYIYYTEDEWENGFPSIETNDIRQLGTQRDQILNMYVDQWEVDVNFILHVLLSE